MNRSTRTRLIRIGNSQGIRIPKALAEQLHLTDEIEIVVKEHHLEVRQGRKPRQGWDDAFRTMAAQGDDRLIDQPAPTAWDKEEWDW